MEEQHVSPHDLEMLQATSTPKLHLASTGLTLESGVQTSLKDSRRVLSAFSLVGLTYFAVSGGPIGSEPSMAAGGPLIGFIGLLIFPIIWSLPIAAITSELCTAFPEDGGYTVWVLHAFGPFWAFQTGYWAWISGVIDNALYPALALETISKVWGSVDSPLEKYFVKAIITIGLAIPNLMGVKLVGSSMICLSVFVMLPFVVLGIWGIAMSDDWGALGEIRRSDPVTDADGSVTGMTGSITINWSLLINTLFWNYSGSTDMSVFGGEVANPSRTYPIAMLMSVLMILLTYAIPLLGAVVYNKPNWSSWDEGSFSDIAKAIGGHSLYVWIVLASLGSNIGMYITELFTDGFQLYGMAECGLAPKFLSARNKRFDTPHNSILCSVVIMLVLIIFSFEDIVTMTNALASFYNLFIIFAFLRLRVSHPEVPRPYKAPGNLVFLFIMSAMPTLLLGYIAVDTFSQLTTGLLAFGIVSFGLVYAHFKKFTAAQFEQLRTSES